MPFSLRDISAAWARSDGVCECTGSCNRHEGRCTEKLLWNLQGGEIGYGWRACRKAAWGTDVLANCEIRCVKCQGCDDRAGGVSKCQHLKRRPYV
jgi:hypothetical protein